MLRTAAYALFTLCCCGILLAAGRVEGIVVDSVVRSPIPGATVEVRWKAPPGGKGSLAYLNSTGPSVVTDENGRFSIEVAGPSDFTLHARKDGFGQLSGSSHSMTIVGDEAISGVVLILPPESSLAGIVRDSKTGAPVSNLGVSVIMRRQYDGLSVWQPGGGTTTGSDGRFLVEGLSPNRYKLCVGPSSRPMVRRRTAAPHTSLRYPRSCYPGMSDLSSSSEIELVAGARMDGLDFRIDAEKAFRVRGRVVRADGQPVNGPLSFHIRQDGATGNRAYLMLGEISESSEFELFNVPRGQTLVAVSSEDSGNGRLTGFIMSDVFDRDLDDIEVILQPGITLSGVVRSEGVEDGQVDPLWKEATAEVGVRIVPQGVLGVAGKGAAAVTRGTGRWLTDGVIPTWSAPVLTGLPPGYVVTALHYNGVSYNNGEMQLNPAAISHELRITVCRVSNSVTVEAFKDRKSPAAKAQVLLVSSGRYTGGDRRKILSAVADEAGRHTFSNLEPGKYCVAAVDASSDLGQAMRFVDEGRCNSVEVERTSNETIATTIR